MKNKGQALTEFIILLPVMMLLVLGMIDFGNIIYQKYKLENDLDTVVDLYRNEDQDHMSDYASKMGITTKIDEDTATSTIRVTKKVRIYAPGLNRILKSPLEVEAKRVVYHES